MTIFDAMGEEALLAGLAEECMELGKSLLKRVRCKRGENPTPVKSEDCIDNIVEEVADVELYLEQVKNCSWFRNNKEKYDDFLNTKRARWKKRLEDAKGVNIE